MKTKPTPRKSVNKPSDTATVLFALLMVALMATALWWGLSTIPQTEKDLRPQNTIKHDSLAPTYTYDGEVIRWYVFTDPDSGVQYLVNDRGGVTPRLDQYGDILGVEPYTYE